MADVIKMLRAEVAEKEDARDSKSLSGNITAFNGYRWLAFNILKSQVVARTNGCWIMTDIAGHSR